MLDRITDQNTKKYIAYCRDIVFVNLVRICKLALEFKFPELAEQISESIKPIELSNNFPYCSVNRLMPSASRRITHKMADLMFQVGKNMGGESLTEKCIPMDESQMHVLEKMLGMLTPQLEKVCATVKNNLEGVSEADMEARLSDTLGQRVNSNIGAILKSDIKNDIIGIMSQKDTSPDM